MKNLLAARSALVSLLGEHDPSQEWWLFGQCWISLYKIQTQITIRHHLREEVPS